MSGGSGLRRFVAGADTRTGAAQARAEAASAGTDASAAQAQATSASTEATAAQAQAVSPSPDASAAQARADAADARATLSAAIGRPLDRADQPAASTGPTIKTGPGAATDVIEKCEICSAVIPAEHGHLADLETSSLQCACRACYLLFTQSEAVRGRYRAIPDRYLTDPEHPISTFEWDALEIPVGLAFFLRDSRTGEVTGFYPSPAGATECRLDLQAWADLTTDHPLLAAAEPDVEAILISRSDRRIEESSGQPVETFVVPIDACYELAGRMRLYWRGFDGGSEARASIAEFLDSVRTRARSLNRGA